MALQIYHQIDGGSGGHKHRMSRSTLTNFGLGPSQLMDPSSGATHKENPLYLSHLATQHLVDPTQHTLNHPNKGGPNRVKSDMKESNICHGWWRHYTARDTADLPKKSAARSSQRSKAGLGRWCCRFEEILQKSIMESRERRSMLAAQRRTCRFLWQSSHRFWE